MLIDQGEYFDPRFRHDGGLHVRPGYATDVITDLALGWLDGLDDDRPYCLLIHHKAPHRPWEPDAAHAGMFTDPIPVPATFDDDYATRTDAARRAAMRIADHLTAEDLKVDPPAGLAGEALTRWKYQRYMEDYLACVASVDDNVGRVLDCLDERGELDDTIVIYTSDQGFFLGDHGWYDKRFMYEQSLRMPMLVRYPPAIPAGAVVDAMVTNVDFAPTLLDAAGARPVAPMQGRSFWPLLTGALVGADPRRGVLPLLRERRRQPPRAGALRRPHHAGQARLLLQRRARTPRHRRLRAAGGMGAVRPRRGSRRGRQPLRRSDVPAAP